CAINFWCRLIHLKIILWNKPLEIGLCNKAYYIKQIINLFNYSYKKPTKEEVGFLTILMIRAV
ncbi:hypothetical protein MEP47_18175, partial [Acinetobacter baumannii]|nr:hypothetical protein [Acinetobacter baumannii]